MDESGVVRAPNGNWITAPKSPAPITHANARSMAQRRWEKVRQKSANRVLAEAVAIDPTVKDTADAMALLVSKQYVMLVDSDKPKMSDVEKMGNILTGSNQLANSQRDNPAPPAGTISASPAVLLDLLDQMERRRQTERDQAQAIDGQLHEADTNG